MTVLAPSVKLANGVEMPGLGLGTWPLDDLETERTVAEAIQRGYRLIDTAENYANETGVGRGIRSSGIDRSEVFVTSKFNVKWHGFNEVQEAWAHSVRKLDTDYIDLLLIHWPNPGRDRYADAWRGMVKLLEDGKVRAIGLSNFKPAHIDRVIEATGVTPHVNQVQLNPYITRATERAAHEKLGIVTEAWAPLGRGGELLRDPVLARIAEQHGRTPAQIALRWSVQLGFVPIPKSSDPERLSQNLDVFGFELTDEEMQALAALDRKGAGAADSDRTGH